MIASHDDSRGNFEYAWRFDLGFDSALVCSTHSSAWYDVLVESLRM